MAITRLNNNSITSITALPSGVGGVTMADHWRLTADIAGPSANITTSSIEQVDTSMQSNLGSSMTYSSGIFTFPSTGLYLILFKLATTNATGDETVCVLQCEATTDNSSYSVISQCFTSARPEHNNQTSMGSTLIDVTDTSNCKVRFSTTSQEANTSVMGDSTKDETTFTFIKLGET